MEKNFYKLDLMDESSIKCIKEFCDNLFSDGNSYIINKPLIDESDDYANYRNFFMIVSPNYKVMLVSINPKEHYSFEDYKLDIQEDISFLIKKYKYNEIVSRPRLWRDKYVNTVEMNLDFDSLRDFIKRNEVKENKDKRFIKIITSLIIGSINDPSKIKSIEIQDNILDMVKHKITLFDTQQSEFLYGEENDKIIKIEGLAGTGKTELLMQKIQMLYTNTDFKIAFTCFNKVLANELKKRVVNYFNYMKVEEQIDTNRLLICSSWGSHNDMKSGLYSYICHYYNIAFEAFSYFTSFYDACNQAYKEIKKLPREQQTPCFDFIFIDECQDFDKSFIALCALVTSQRVYLAGDTFQDIFNYEQSGKIKPDYVLTNCYRSDPKTLLFSHALSMGLMETPHLRWMSEEQRNACGYDVRPLGINKKKMLLSRIPLIRFDDENFKFERPFEIVRTGNNQQNEILKILKTLKKEYPKISPSDIAIVFLENTYSNYDLFGELKYLIYKEIGWGSIVGYEEKQTDNDKIYLSNINNIKGLEFCFVICVASYKLGNNINQRNKLYTILTRSFLRTYLLINDNFLEEDVLENYEKCLNDIYDKNYISVQIPTEEEIKSMKESNYSIPIKNSIKHMAEKIMNEMNVDKKERADLHKFLMKCFDDVPTMDDLRNKIEQYLGLIKK